MITVCIIAKDAEKTLSRCLQSVLPLTSSIIVVVDDSTRDTTATIAESFKAQVYVRHFDNFATQKNFALLKAPTDWVLSLDADEELDPKLVTEIKALSLEKSAYAMPRHNIIFGKIIRHTNWDPNSIVRLIKKSSAKFVGPVHEQLVVVGEIGQLVHPIIHYNYDTVESYLARLNLYTSLESDTRETFSPISLIFDPIFDFVRRYIWHKGFLDGLHGLFLSYLQAIYHLTIWVKVWQKTNKSS